MAASIYSKNDNFPVIWLETGNTITKKYKYVNKIGMIWSKFQIPTMCFTDEKWLIL